MNSNYMNENSRKTDLNDLTCFALPFLDNKGSIFLSYSNDGVNWSDETTQSLFDGWQTNDNPTLCMFNDVLYMCLTDVNNKIFFSHFDVKTNEFTEPKILFDGWETYLGKTPNLIVTSNLLMVLLDETGRIYLAELNNNGTFDKPFSILGNRQNTQTPNFFTYKSELFLCLVGLDKSVYISGFDRNNNQWTDPENILNNWQVFNNAMPTFYSTYEKNENQAIEEILNIVLLDNSGTLFTALKSQAFGWSECIKLFGGWQSNFSPQFALHNDINVMSISGRQGNFYTTIYDFENKEWLQPVKSLFGNWRTLENITPKIIYSNIVKKVLNSKNWMTNLDSNKLISEITIPGTHDTGARYGGQIVECQNLTVEEQLNAGIRYLDVRCRHIKDVFTIHHSSFYQRINFGEGVLKVCLDFLKENQNEFIIMAIDEASSPDGCTRSFADTFWWYLNLIEYKVCKDVFYLENDLAKINDIRGKIVLLRRFDYTYDSNNSCKIPKNLGINVAHNWDSDVDHCEIILEDKLCQELYIQDRNSINPLNTLNDKWEIISDCLDQAYNNNNKNTLYLNFMSGSTGLFPETIATGSPSLFKLIGENYRLRDRLKNNPKGRFGIINMDFPETPNNLIDLIIKTNFKD